MSYITSDIKTGSIEQLRNLTPLELKQYDLFYCIEDGKEGNFKVDLTDTTSVDNLGTILVTTSGVRLKRVIENGEVCPEWFGAKGDGTTDDKTAIQNALNAGKNVLFAENKTYITTRLQLKDNQSLKGRNTTLKLKSNSNDYIILCFTPVSDIKIEGIKFDGNELLNTNNPPAVEFRGSSNIQISDCKFENCSKFFLLNFDGCTNKKITNCRFYNYYEAGINNCVLNTSATNAGNIEIENCYFEKMTSSVGAGILLKNQGYNCFVRNCYFTDQHDSAIIVTSGHDIEISECSGDTFGASIWFGSYGVEPDISKIKVSDCRLKSENDVSIGITNTTYFQVSDCNLSFCGMDGLWLETCEFGTVSNCNITNNGGQHRAGRENGIFLTDNATAAKQCRNITIKGCRIGNDGTTFINQKYGINHGSYSDYIETTNCTFFANTVKNIATIDGRQLNCIHTNNIPNYSSQPSGSQNLVADFLLSKVVYTELYDNIYTFSLKNASKGDIVTLIIAQKSLATYTVNAWASNVKFQGGAIPRISQGVGKIDVFSFLYDGTNYIECSKQPVFGNVALVNGVATIYTPSVTPNSGVFPVTKTIIGTSAHAYTYDVGTAGTLVITARQSNGNVETGCNSIVTYQIIN